ncbi:MAG TPA: hypothetical protein VKD70_14350 [Candidatus Acidoferrum sp.]|nr:hypothetical protein [Candidatus Acidoferrum sp.]
MFAFFKKAMPAAEVANELWGGISGNHRVLELAASALEATARPDAAALGEIIYFLGFATDLTIHRVFQHQPALEAALRDSFLDRLRDYAVARQCTPCPIGDWVGDSPNWFIRSPGRDAGDPIQHLDQRFDLYRVATRRPTQTVLPVIIVLAALCRARDIVIFDMEATSLFTDYSSATEELLRQIRVKARKAQKEEEQTEAQPHGA